MLDLLRYQGTYRTSLNTFTAGDAHGFLQRLVAKGAHLQIITPVGHLNGVNPHNFTTCPNADATLDTLVGIEIKKGIAPVNGQFFRDTIQPVETVLVKTDTIDERLQTTRAALGTQKAVEVMITQDQLKGYPSNLVDFGIIGDNTHSFFHRGSAGGQEFLLFFNLDQTYAANTL
jgi:hypothetical protein